MRPPSSAVATPSSVGDRRVDALDALRGLAMVWMTAFHASFDLAHQGLLRGQDFYQDPFWTLQRTAIVSLFLFCAGAGQGLALAAQAGWARFWSRWWRIAGCALLVSLGSAWMFPHSWISFGVLHGMALMLVLVRLLVGVLRWPAAAVLTLALVCVLLPLSWQHAWFDSRWTNWIGLVTHKPATEDYVPLLPWLGPMLLGSLAGRWLARAPRSAGRLVTLPRLMRGLVLLGRWPLSYYMLHQPVLIGLISVWAWLMGRAA
ncbi:MAG: hypothetical protein RIQ60_4086 [Pseudomonadota bacterium]|jgi:uncharacterized membrane protein